MAIGKRIHDIRIKRGMTQKQLGMMVGFSERTADIRIAQYESETRIPKNDILLAIANALGVSPMALSVPDIDTQQATMHTFFALEDFVGVRITELDNTLCLTIDLSAPDHYSYSSFFRDWYKAHEKLNSGEYSQEDYDNWRYNYPDSQWEITKVELDEIRRKQSLQNE